MKLPHKAVKISDKVYWVGAIDWGVRDFHGYLTSRGTTYNAYLIMAEKPVLIDTVKSNFYGEMHARISSVTDPANVKIIISNHSEMDHSGGLCRAVEDMKPERILASAMGVKALAAHFHHKYNIEAVKEGETLDIGGDKIAFLESRMLHWPDSMVSFLQGDGILFSNDIFGMHLASSKRFDDETPDWKHEAKKYYANIVLPYSDMVLSFLKKFQASGIKPRVIAPDHGPIWRKDLTSILDLYAQWATQKPKDKAVVVYDTMWNSTEKMAGAIADGLMSSGTETRVMPLKSHHRSDVITELLCAGAVAVGSPTLNRNLYPTVADTLTYIKGLQPRNLKGLVFGSYGWGGEGISQVSSLLQEMKVQPALEPLKVQYVPDDAMLAKCFEAGVALSKAAKGS